MFEQRKARIRKGEQIMIPRIQNDNGIPTLYVHDKPFFARSGEIHNSSSSNLDYMEEHVWPALRELNMNSVIVPLYWETMEPQEGIFDYIARWINRSGKRRTETFNFLVVWALEER